MKKKETFDFDKFIDELLSINSIVELHRKLELGFHTYPLKGIVTVTIRPEYSLSTPERPIYMSNTNNEEKEEFLDVLAVIIKTPKNSNQFKNEEIPQIIEKWIEKKRKTIGIEKQTIDEKQKTPIKDFGLRVGVDQTKVKHYHNWLLKNKYIDNTLEEFEMVFSNSSISADNWKPIRWLRKGRKNAPHRTALAALCFHLLQVGRSNTQAEKLSHFFVDDKGNKVIPNLNQGEDKFNKYIPSNKILYGS
ncbi:MAG: hypothetical protein RBT74_06715 [Tenuifilaceae bacterium]|jgi:hypothetical protein|nr:hypothetical protein [Tenuifilaceae bacterium]